jgi:hypothetical protein
MLIFFIHHALKFAYQPGHLKVKRQSSGRTTPEVGISTSSLLKDKANTMMKTAKKKFCWEDGLKHM